MTARPPDAGRWQRHVGFSRGRGIPDIGTIYFGAYRLTGPWGPLEADSGVLVSSDGRTRRLPAPVRRDDTTISGAGWTLKVAPGRMVRAGTRLGDYEVVKRP